MTQRVAVFRDDAEERPISIEEMSSPLDSHSVEMTEEEAVGVYDALGNLLKRPTATAQSVIDFLNKADSANIRAIQRGLDPSLAFGKVKIV